MTWSQAVSSRDDSHPFEFGETLLLWQGRGFCGVRRTVRCEDAHAQPGEVPRGYAECFAYKEDETRGEETARLKAQDERKKQRFILWCELVQGFDKASINLVGDASQHQEAPHPDVAHLAGGIEDGTSGKGDRTPHQCG